MPYTDSRIMTTSSTGAKIPVYWCSYGCNKGHSDRNRVEEHENELQTGVQMARIIGGGHHRYECKKCHLRGEQPFDIAVHVCPLQSFVCPNRAPEPKSEDDRRSEGSSSARSSFSVCL